MPGCAVRQGSNVLSNMRLFLLALAMFAQLACTTDPSGPEVTFPARMRLEATAAGTADGREIKCRIDFIVELAPAGSAAWASAGGDAYRESLDGTGAGIAFWADAYYPDVRLAYPAGSIFALIGYQDGAPIAPVTDSRFWDELRAFHGRPGPSPELASGPWACRPMDTRGDSLGTVLGTWTLHEY